MDSGITFEPLANVRREIVSEPDNPAEKDPARGRAGATVQSTAPETPLWLLGHRSTIPVRSSSFFRRDALTQRCLPTARRLTLLIAPGGFGKTSLLAECCRDAVESGTPVAWLTLDGRDEPAMLDAYLAYAFDLAGMDILVPLDSDKADPHSPYPCTALLMRAVAAYGGPVVLGLDEVERLTDPALVAHVNFLVRAAPANLHLALAGRELPPGLDVSESVLGSDAEILTAEDLRFTRKDIAGFFGHRLSRRDLDSVAAMSAGWPIALRIRHNENPADMTGSDRVVRDVVENWVESRLWYSFTEPERELLLDVGLFDWMDAELVEEALGTRGALRCLREMRGLDGLLVPVRANGSEIWQLHGLIRDYCVAWRRRNTPLRYRRVQHDIAVALARRGRIVAAMRHAAQAEDGTLLATVLLDAGGVRLWLREGMERLVATDRLLSRELIAEHPRLAPVRCVALAARGRLPDARRVLRSVLVMLPQAPSADDLDLFLDACLAQAMVSFFGCESALTEEMESMMTQARHLVEAPSFDPVVRWGWEMCQCVHLGLHASFDEAMDHGRRLRRLAGAGRPELASVIDVQFGLIAMAQGRVREALSWYRSGHRLARKSFLAGPQLASIANVLRRELDIERNLTEVADAGESLPREMHRGAQLAAHFAASDIALELKRATRGTDVALELLEDLWAQTLRVGYPALERHLAAQRVSLLVDVGRTEDARQAWTAGGLPETDAACADLIGQSWREAESVTCARLRLCTAVGEFDAGRRLGRTMLEVAAKRGLKRTAMRVRVLCLKLEERSGAGSAAIAHLVAYLEMFVETDYARALVREGAVAATVVERFLHAQPDSPLRDTAEGLLALIRATPATVPPRISERELEVLRRLETDRDDDIAAAIGISRHGVRYRLRSIFGKLGVHTRRKAVARARALGILPPAE